jgi:hypothetical protein
MLRRSFIFIRLFGETLLSIVLCSAHSLKLEPENATRRNTVSMFLRLDQEDLLIDE